jgi:plasmid stability protein
MKNITITLDEQTAAWLRVHAAKRGASVSRFVGDVLNERMREGRDYDEAMRHFLTQKPREFEWADGRRPTREEIHDRTGAREDLAREEAK